MLWCRNVIRGRYIYRSCACFSNGDSEQFMHCDQLYGCACCSGILHGYHYSRCDCARQLHARPVQIEDWHYCHVRGQDSKLSLPPSNPSLV
jgi:hypothetical protein